MNRFYKILSLLLDYPDEQTWRELAGIEAAIAGLPAATASADEKKVLAAHCSWMRSQPLLELQAQYVQTFDLTAEHSLHLTHHLFGDDRGRGPALVDLGEFYKHTGLESSSRELPDYLPLVLEYVATLDEMGARVFLSDAAKVIKVLAENLAKAGSRYAALMALIDKRAGMVPQAANS